MQLHSSHFGEDLSGKYPAVQNIVLTEGAAFNDMQIEGHVQENDRIQFYNQYLQQVQWAKCKEDKGERVFCLELYQ